MYSVLFVISVTWLRLVLLSEDEDEVFEDVLSAMCYDYLLSIGK